MPDLEPGISQNDEQANPETLEVHFMDQKVQHLEMIQGIVNRLSTNSFLLKGWSVVLISALFALAAKDANVAFVYLAYFPTLAFWALDGYFLWQERLYRGLYDHVRGLPVDEIDFSMNTKAVKDNTSTWLSTAFSVTLVTFHGTIILTILLVMLLLILYF